MNKAFLMAATAVGGAVCGVAKENVKPNFLFILVDDLGQRDLSCYGSTFHETPNLDSFAKSAVKFNHAYSASVSSPTRASILTGKNPARHGITQWIPGGRYNKNKLLTPEIPNELSKGDTTLAEAFHKGGYKTFFAGKWHLGHKGSFPEDHGFDINVGGYHRGQPDSYYSPYGNPNMKDGEKGEYLTDRLTTESMNFMEEQTKKSEPFLLYLSYYTVHTPIQACKRHLSKFQEKGKELSALPREQSQRAEGDAFTKLRQDRPDYASMVHAMDENVGRLLRKLDELKIDKNTVVIFTSDNGGLSTLYRNGYPTSNEPFRAGKGWLYEGGIREPLIVRWPGVTKAGREVNIPITCEDYYPTMLEMAGLKLMPNQHKDGKSFASLLKGQKTSSRSLYWHYPHYHGSGWKPGAAVRKGDWKLLEFFEDNRFELYNLKKDVGEKSNLAAKNPAKLKELKAEMKKWRKRTNAKLPTLNPNWKSKK